MPLNRRHLIALSLAPALLPQARACEYTTPYLRVLHPWTRATSGDRCLVSMKFEDVFETERLVGVQTPVAGGARLAGPGAAPQVDFEIPAGRPSQLHEEGTVLELTGLQMPLEVGRSYPLTLVFAKAGEIPATLNVDFTAFRFR